MPHSNESSGGGLGDDPQEIEKPMRTFLAYEHFLYAAGGEHPRRAACVRMLQRVAKGPSKPP